jgi:hypothetical protein
VPAKASSQPSHALFLILDYQCGRPIPVQPRPSRKNMWCLIIQHDRKSNMHTAINKSRITRAAIDRWSMIGTVDSTHPPVDFFEAASRSCSENNPILCQEAS